MADTPIVAKRSHVPNPYCPQWLAKYARKNKLAPDVYAFKHAIEQSRSNVDAARILGISLSTFDRAVRRWEVKIER